MQGKARVPAPIFIVRGDKRVGADAESGVQQDRSALATVTLPPNTVQYWLGRGRKDAVLRCSRLPTLPDLRYVCMYSTCMQDQDYGPQGCCPEQILVRAFPTPACIITRLPRLRYELEFILLQQAVGTEYREWKHCSAVHACTDTSTIPPEAYPSPFPSFPSLRSLSFPFLLFPFLS